jgi:uncharacterized protein YprB with RNaseH-like and TPR domain
MDLQRKLARLAARAPAAPPPPEPVPDVPVAPAPSPAEASVFDALRVQLQRRRGRLARASVGADVALFHDAAPWPFAPTESEHGTLHRSRTRLDPAAKHGAVPVQRALAARGEALATLGLDAALAGVDVARALFLDTETTGLSGGTGTLAFLVGVAYFEDDELVVEQLFVHDPDAEAALLSRVAALVAGASALITFNGKSFDLPLLRSRFVLARVEPPALPPHLDLLHVARRIYGARVERCSLTTLERDVLRFERLDDVAGEDIPERYRRYLREGDRAGVVPVVRHNLWDLVALAALTGELAARVARAPSEGRFEADDHVGMARTSLRAGDHAGAIAHAADALSHGQGDASRAAHLIAARAHHKTGDALGRSGRLLAALALAPHDPAIHLELARCYERDLDDAHRALEHAHQAHGAEPPSALAKRVQRLTRRCQQGVQLRLPGF